MTNGTTLFLGEQIIDDDRRARPLRPFGAGVAQAVVEIEHGILAIGGIARGRVDAQHATKPEGLRIVLDDLHLAVGNVFARDVVAGGGLWVNVQTFGRARRLDIQSDEPSSHSTFLTTHSNEPENRPGW